MTESRSITMPSHGTGGLEVSGLTLTAGDTTLVHGASFRLQAGELAALLGPERCRQDQPTARRDRACARRGWLRAH